MNQNPEQLARDRIDAMLIASGWVIQSKKTFNLAAGLGVAIREYQTDAGPADYILFVAQKPVGIIEAKCYGCRLVFLLCFDATESKNNRPLKDRLKRYLSSPSIIK